MKLISWNVNGIRAVLQKGFKEWVLTEQPDILCVQETKIHATQLADLDLAIPGYQAYWSCGERKGYSGVGTYTKVKPETVAFGMGIEKFDNEGRTLVTEYPEFTLLNNYFPNGQMGDDRLAYKMEFYDALLAHCQTLMAAGKKLVLCGDLNTAHQEIDLKNPKANAKNSGFLPEERVKVDEYLAAGFVDTFRQLYPEVVKYSWWSYRFAAREKNVGWRIDYFLVTPNLFPSVRDAGIMDEVTGSDHCPVTLILG